MNENKSDLIIGLVVFGIIFYFIFSAEDEKAPQVKPVIYKNLNITFEQFKNSFNGGADFFQAPDLKIVDAEFETGGRLDSYKYNFSPNLKLQVFTNGESKLIEMVNVITTPESFEDSAQSLVVFGLVIDTLSPGLTAESRYKILQQLCLTEDTVELLNTGDGVAIIGDVKYYTRYADEGKTLQFKAIQKDYN